MPLAHLQHMQHPDLLFNIHMKHLQHISETLETYVALSAQHHLVAWEERLIGT
jgi:hypothetical protein